MQVRTKTHRRLDGWQGSQSSRVSAIACGCLGEELAGALWDVISLFSRLIAMTGSVAVNVTLSLGSVQVADQTMFLYSLHIVLICLHLFLLFVCVRHALNTSVVA